jgi:protocatechuate 3,4-dioxygenase beta subunit
MKSLDRRMLLGGAASVLALTASRSLRAAVQTPSGGEGPFYPPSDDLLSDQDNDLVRVAGAVREAGGRILHLTGSVVRRDGAALSGALVEIWQCDANGRYRHSGDTSQTRKRDPYFQGYGKSRTDQDGRYAFRTIKPVVYPGRTPHIHAKVHDPRIGSVLTTQMYVAGESRNDTDFLYQQLSAEQQTAVTVDLIEAGDGDLKGDFRIVL